MRQSDGDERSVPLVFRVESAEEGLRLDAFLAGRCPEHSRSRIQNDLAEGRARVDGRVRAKNFRLAGGENVEFEPSPVRELSAEPQDIPLNIVHEDDSILILDKPAGLVVHPAAGAPDGTVVNALLHHGSRLADSGNALRPGIVHRLDRDTTGLLAVALTEQAHRSLSEQLRDHSMGRTYLALSWGRWPDAEGRLEGNIGRHPKQRHRMAVVHSGGRRAVTHYRVLEDLDFAQYCEVRLETGRTHQIRVHFANEGHPVIGDPVYGSDQRVRGVHPLDKARAERVVARAGRQMLHAARLELRHPATGETMVFEAPLPADFREALELARTRD